MAFEQGINAPLCQIPSLDVNESAGKEPYPIFNRCK